MNCTIARENSRLKHCTLTLLSNLPHVIYAAWQRYALFYRLCYVFAYFSTKFSTFLTMKHSSEGGLLTAQSENAKNVPSRFLSTNLLVLRHKRLK